MGGHERLKLGQGNAVPKCNTLQWFGFIKEETEMSHIFIADET